jgi:hypothetical protein
MCLVWSLNWRKCIILSGGAQGGFEKKLKKVFWGWGVENVANVEMLPVPMLPMANGAGAEARRGFAGVEARHPE